MRQAVDEDNGNTNNNNKHIGKGKENEPFIPPTLTTVKSPAVKNNMKSTVKEHEAFIPPITEGKSNIEN